MSDQTPLRPDDERFSFGLAELQRAARARALESRPAAAVRTSRAPLKIEKAPCAGFDPYNSTGGFDRHNAWSRVRKR